MTKEREALRMALEALGKAKRQIVHANIAPHGCIGEAITAIQEALAQEPVMDYDKEELRGTVWDTNKQSLAQPEQEPVATKTEKGITLHVGWDDLPSGTKLYTSPPRPDLTDADRKTYQAGHNAGVAHHKQATKREWVGLTHDEHMEIMTGSMTTSSRIAAVEALLKEKNT